MDLLTVSKRTAADDYEYTRRQPVSAGHWLMMAAITAGAFAIRYWYNFVFPHMSAASSCDASEYLRNAGNIIEAFRLPMTFWADAWSMLTGNATPGMVARMHIDLAPLQDLKISGPIFPLFLAGSYALASAPFNAASINVPVIAQTLISAFTCLFIGLTASRTFGKPCGYAAGILASVYPAFIINSERLYSETFAAFLLSVVCYITVRNFDRKVELGSFCWSSFVAGFAAACLQLTRSIMVLLTLALLPITLFQQGFRRGVPALLLLILGAAAVLVPWVAFQKVAFGTSSLVVDRVGHYNFFVGNDASTFGWLSVPYQDLRGVEEKPMIELAREAYERSPSHWWSLMLDKPLRLFAFPWNDFRQPIGGGDFKTQVLFHQILLLLAAIGIPLGFTLGSSERSPDYDYERGAMKTSSNTAAKFFLLFVLLLHASYLFFITVPRYNLTGMVVLTVFAGAGIGCLVRVLVTSGVAAFIALVTASTFLIVVPRLPMVNVAASLLGGDHAFAGLVAGKVFNVVALLAFAISLLTATAVRRGSGDGKGTRALLPACAIFLVTLVLLPEFALQANASGRWYEWACPLMTVSKPVEQTFALPANLMKQLEERQVFLMVDADSGADVAAVDVSVNGARLDAPIIPGLSLIQGFERFQPSANNMREVEWIFHSLASAAGTTPANLRQWFLIPLKKDSLQNVTQLTVQLRPSTTGSARVYGTYDISSKRSMIPSTLMCSWEKAFYGVENESGFSDPRYTIKFDETTAKPVDTDLSPQPGVQSGRFNIRLLASPPAVFHPENFVLRAPTSDQYEVLDEQQIVLPPRWSGQTPQTVTIAGLPQYSAKDLWVVRLSGEVRHTKSPAMLSIHVSAVGDNRQHSYGSPWAADTKFTDEWRRFDVSVPVQPGALPSPPNKLAFTLKSTLPFGYAESTDDATEIRNVRMQILSITNPMQPGQVIF